MIHGDDDGSKRMILFNHISGSFIKLILRFHLHFLLKMGSNFFICWMFSLFQIRMVIVAMIHMVCVAMKKNTRSMKLLCKIHSPCTSSS